MAGSTLRWTVGSTDRTLPIYAEMPARLKPRTGETYRQTGKLLRDDILDAPYSIENISGLGVSRAGAFQVDADNRCFEMPNMQAWPGMICLGPAPRTTTDVTGTRQTIGFFQFRNNLFAFADVAGTTSTETIQKWNVNGTWGDSTAVADFNATVAGSGFLTVGMTEQDGRCYALRTIFILNGAARYQLIYTTDGTTWTLIDHVNAADCPGPDTSYVCKGLVSIVGVMYTATLNSSNQILLRQNAAGNNGVTWTTTATSKESVTSITGMGTYHDYADVERPFVFTPEGVFLWDGTTFYKAIKHNGENDSTAGKNSVIWDVDGVPSGYLCYPKGKKLLLNQWIGSSSTRSLTPQNIAPTFDTQGLPSFRDGNITALASTNNFLYAAIGGDSASTTGGIYVRRTGALHPLNWFGPIYDIGTANRQIRAMFVSSYSDGVMRLHVAVDNGTANDTDLLYFDNITSDPRTVSSYLHTSSTGYFVGAKNDRGLPETNKAWRKQEAIGTNFSSDNKIAAVYAIADSAPVASNGSLGSTLGAITASGGTVNFPATPTGTGLSAKAVQTVYSVTGTSNASPYIEAFNTYLAAFITPKMIRRFVVDLQGNGSVQSSAKLRTDFESIPSAMTDLQVVSGDRPATIMELYVQGGNALTYTDDPTKDTGTVNAHLNVKFGIVELVEV